MKNIDKGFGTKNKGGKKDLPNPHKTPGKAVKRLHRKTPEQN